MDQELVSLASTAATTVVQLLTTDAWQRLKNALGPLADRSRKDRADAFAVQLDDSRAEIIAAGDDTQQAQQAQQELTAEWQGRLRRLLASDPGLAAELRRVLDEELVPLLGRTDPDRADIRMRAVVSDQGQAYQAGRDMHITGQ